MIKKPSVSIIIPVKGRLQFVKEAISSIYSQKRFDLNSAEIIICEEKNYGEVVRYKIKKAFPKIKIIVNKDKEGPGCSRNSGLRIAQGKYIVFLDSDDKLKQEFLYKMLSILKSDKICSSVVCFSNAIFNKPYKLSRRIKLFFLMLIRDISLLISYFINNHYLFPSAFYLCQISHMMFKTEAVKKLRFNYDYRKGGEDWDFFNQCLTRGPIRILPRRLLIFRYSQLSSTNLPVNLKLKWQSYQLLASRMPSDKKKSLYYKLFLSYIQLFRGEK